MAEVARLELVADARGIVRARDELGRFSKQARATEGVLGGLNGRVSSLTKVLGALGAGYAAGQFLSAIIRNTIEAEQVQAQLEARLRSTGGAAGFALGELNDMAQGLQRVTTFGDEAIGSAQALLLTFTKIKGDQFEQATEAALDLSVAMGTDLQSAALQLGKALNDPILGISAMSRAGIQFSEDQKKVIKSLVETGDVAGAQTIILKELEVQTGGSARAMRDTLGGALDAAKNAFGDLLEGDTGGDGIRGTVGAINNLTDTMQSPETKAGFQAMIQGLASVANFAAQTISMIGGVGDAINQMTKDLNEKSRSGLIQEQMRLEDDLKALETPTTFDDFMRARFDGGGIGLLNNVEENAENVRNRLNQVIDAIAEIDKRANAPRDESGPRTAPAVITPTMSSDVAELTDKLREQADTLGLTRSALLEYQKQQALSEATNDVEKQAITEAYDALIVKTRAEEAATASAKGASAAAKEKAEAERAAAAAERERATALGTIDGILQDQAAQLGGPLVQAAQNYADTLLRLVDAESQLAENGGLTAEAMTQLAIARQQAADSYQKEVEAIQARLTPGEQMLDDLQFELSLRKMSNVEAQTAIQLRGLETAEVIKYGDAIRAANVELENGARATEALDAVRSSASNLLMDLTDRTKSTKEAFMDFIDGLMKKLTELVISRLMESAFGAPGQQGGGAWGDSLMGIFGALFGGAKAAGGATSGRKIHQVNENGPEVWSDGRNDWLLPTGRGGQVKQSSGAGNVYNVSVNVAASESRKTMDQVANRTADVMRTSQRRNK